MTSLSLLLCWSWTQALVALAFLKITTLRLSRSNFWTEAKSLSCELVQPLLGVVDPSCCRQGAIRALQTPANPGLLQLRPVLLCSEMGSCSHVGNTVYFHGLSELFVPYFFLLTENQPKSLEHSQPHSSGRAGCSRHFSTARAASEENLQRKAFPLTKLYVNWIQPELLNSLQFSLKNKIYSTKQMAILPSLSHS